MRRAGKLPLSARLLPPLLPLGLLLAAPRHAQADVPGLTLTWSAPPGCPEHAELEENIAKLLGEKAGRRAVALDASVEVTMALGPSELVGFVGTHYDYSGGLEASCRTELLKQVAGHSADRVAMISARQLLDWLDLRNSSSFDALSFDGSHAAFTLELPEGKPNPGLEAMLPAQMAGRTLTSIERDGAPAPILRFEEVRSVQYAFFEAASGRYRAIYQ